jgi:hypothetical protein
MLEDLDDLWATWCEWNGKPRSTADMVAYVLWLEEFHGETLVRRRRRRARRRSDTPAPPQTPPQV